MRGIAICALLCACRTTPEAPPPSAEEEITLETADRLTVRDQSLTGFVAVLAAKLVNGGDTEARAASARIELQIDGKQLAAAEVKLDAAAPPGGEASLELALTGTYASNGEELAGLAAREQLGALLRGEVRVQSGGASLEIPFSRAGPVRAPRVPAVAMKTVESARNTDDAVSLTFYLSIQNPNPFELKVNRLRYALRINDRPMIEGTTAQNEKVPAGAAAVYELPVGLTAQTFGTDLARHVREGKLTYSITGELDYGLATLPVDLAGPVPVSR